jgi:cytochrome P450
MTWTWYLLAQNPDAEAKLHRALDEVLGDRSPTPEDLDRLPYVHAVISESMRLYPPAWVIGRQAKEAHAVGDTGWTIPEGGVILMSQYVVHRDPRWWDRPDEFLPERWLKADEKARPRYAYFPFGGGPRQCIGEALAWLEAELLLAIIAQRWKLRLARPDDPVRLHATITLRPRDPLPMRVEPRQP